MKPKFPKNKWLYLRGVGKSYLERNEFDKWFRYFTTEYSPPPNKEFVLFIPCAWGKPYSQSYIHYFIIKELQKIKEYDRIHQVIISNAGIIPREFEGEWPFMSYDWNPLQETKKIKEMYLNTAKRRVLRYLKKHQNKYKHIFLYFRSYSEEEEAVIYACKKLKLKYTTCLKKSTFTKLDQTKYTDWDQALIEKSSLKDLILSIKKKIKT